VIAQYWHVFLTRHNAPSGSRIYLSHALADSPLKFIALPLSGIEWMTGPTCPGTVMAAVEDSVLGWFICAGFFVAHMTLSVIVDHVKTYKEHTRLMRNLARDNGAAQGQPNAPHDDHHDSDAEEEEEDNNGAEPQDEAGQDAAPAPMELDELIGLRGNLSSTFSNVLFLLKYALLVLLLAVYLPHTIGLGMTAALQWSSNSISAQSHLNESLLNENFTLPENLASPFLSNLAINIVRGGWDSLNYALELCLEMPPALLGLVCVLFVLHRLSGSLIRSIIRVCCLFVMEIGLLPTLLGYVVRSCVRDLFSPAFFTFSAGPSAASFMSPEALCFPRYASGVNGFCSTVQDSVDPSAAIVDLLRQFAVSPMSLPSMMHAPFRILSLWSFGFATMLIWTRIVRSLRDELAPGTLWFIRFSDDNDFSLVKSFVDDPLPLQAQRFVKTFAFYAFTVLSFIWAPIRFVLLACGPHSPLPLLPITYTMGHLGTLDLFALHFAIPILSELFQPEIPPRQLLRGWLHSVLPPLGLRSLLPGNHPAPASRKLYWGFILVAVFLGWVTLAVSGFSFFFFPLLFGSLLPRVLNADVPPGVRVDFFHWICGMLVATVCFNIVCRIVSVLAQGRVFETVLHVTRLAVRSSPAAVLWHGAIPVLVGRLIEKVLVTPDVLNGQDIAAPLWQAYLFGVLAFRLATKTATTEGLLSEPWRVWVQQFVDEGLGPRMRLRPLLVHVLLPATATLLGALYGPPILLSGFFTVSDRLVDPSNVAYPLFRDRAQHVSHFLCVLCISLVLSMKKGVESTVAMYSRYRDAKYLIGRQLQNADHAR
jgi:hypothetical protein